MLRAVISVLCLLPIERPSKYRYCARIVLTLRSSITEIWSTVYKKGRGGRPVASRAGGCSLPLPRLSFNMRAERGTRLWRVPRSGRDPDPTVWRRTRRIAHHTETCQGEDLMDCTVGTIPTKAQGYTVHTLSSSSFPSVSGCLSHAGTLLSTNL